MGAGSWVAAGVGGTGGRSRGNESRCVLGAGDGARRDAWCCVFLTLTNPSQVIYPKKLDQHQVDIDKRYTYLPQNQVKYHNKVQGNLQD